MTGEIVTGGTGTRHHGQKEVVEETMRPVSEYQTRHGMRPRDGLALQVRLPQTYVIGDGMPLLLVGALLLGLTKAMVLLVWTHGSGKRSKFA